MPCSVPPAELESLLLQHPDVADAAVIGIESVSEATELPRFVLFTFSCSMLPYFSDS
jgi:acyl-coenzyme A synthetase/AMP-(fatty) acid ligase